jgi:hypothetical protein
MTATNRIETLNDVNHAILDAIALPMHPAKAKRLRAARLADLHEIRARMFHEAGTKADDLVAEIFVHACNMAAGRDSDRAAFFRREAGGR